MNKDRKKLDDANLSKVNVENFVEKFEFIVDVCMYGSCGSLHLYFSNAWGIVCKFCPVKN
jgi:hypothetical protein